MPRVKRAIRSRRRAPNCAAATHNGAAVFLEVKLIHAKMACSSETEGYVSWRLSDKLMEGRVSLAAFGFDGVKIDGGNSRCILAQYNELYSLPWNRDNEVWLPVLP